MISFTCSHCGKKLKVKDELAGKKVKCPGCAQSVSVPEQATGAESSKSNGPARAADVDLTVPPRESVPGDQHSQIQAAEEEAQPAAELYNFLAPAEKPDELGRLGPYR